MTQNVEVVKQLIPDPDTDVAQMFREMRDPEVTATARQEVEHLFDPDFEAVGYYTGGTVYRGPEGLRDFWLDWLEPWATYYVGIEQIVEDGDRVLLMSHDRGRRNDMDVEVELHGRSIWTFREGRILRADFYPSAEAIAAAWPLK